MTEHVIAIDPGGRTGWASARMGLDSFELTGSGVLRQDEFARWLYDVQQAWDGGIGHGGRAYDVIVAEAWRPRRINGSMNWIEGDPLLSAQHLGQIRFIADLSGATYREYPASQKPVWIASMPDKLKALDEDSTEQHDKDARMHLWGYFFEEWFSGEGDPGGLINV